MAYQQSLIEYFDKENRLKLEKDRVFYEFIKYGAGFLSHLIDGVRYLYPSPWIERGDKKEAGFIIVDELGEIASRFKCNPKAYMNQIMALNVLLYSMKLKYTPLPRHVFGFEIMLE